MVKGKVHRKNNKDELRSRLRNKLTEIQIKKGINKTMVLAMIVRNEEKNMVRLLTSLKNVVDFICITDTGSTDNTVKCTEDWCKENNIPCIFHFEPFKNFGYNRTMSVINAKKSFPHADYALLSDADFVWKFDTNGKFNKNLLCDEKYLVKQSSSHMSYWNLRILSLKLDWKCWGVTHEYWDEDDNFKGPNVHCTKATTLMIKDIEDGGCKHDKFERDERLLKAGIEDPTSPKDLVTRYYFYLAQTYKDQKKFEDALKYYDLRIKAGGWYEEVFYAKFQSGLCYEGMGWQMRDLYTLNNSEREWHDYEKEFYEKTYEIFLKRKEEIPPEILVKFKSDHEDEKLKKLEIEQNILNYLFTKNFSKAAEMYLAASKFNKNRTEPLYYLTKMYRVLGLNKEAYNIAIKGCKIPYPAYDTLFIEDWCYRGAYDFEFSIVCCYLEGKKEMGKEACAKLLAMENIPEYVRQQTISNSRCYI